MAANSQYTFSQASGLVSELKAGIKVNNAIPIIKHLRYYSSNYCVLLIFSNSTNQGSRRRLLSRQMKHQR
jgi:hypothetical protein